MSYYQSRAACICMPFVFSSDGCSVSNSMGHMCYRQPVGVTSSKRRTRNQLVSTPHHAKPTPVSELILDDESPPCTRADCRVLGLKRVIYLAARLDISCARLGLVGLLSIVFDHILSLEYRSLVLLSIIVLVPWMWWVCIDSCWFFYFARFHALSRCSKSK